MLKFDQDKYTNYYQYSTRICSNSDALMLSNWWYLQSGVEKKNWFSKVARGEPHSEYWGRKFVLVNWRINGIYGIPTSSRFAINFSHTNHLYSPQSRTLDFTTFTEVQSCCSSHTPVKIFQVQPASTAPRIPLLHCVAVAATFAICEGKNCRASPCMRRGMKTSWLARDIARLFQSQRASDWL